MSALSADLNVNQAKSTGGELLCSELEHLGVRHIFGLPGTQNVPLFEALRRSSIRAIVPTHELAAGFMANGYYRASGNVGVLVTIPGPGFAFTLAAIAEASQDSAAVVHITGKPASDGAHQFGLQAIDQRAIFAPLVRATVEANSAADIPGAVREAFAAATAREPGPVLLEIDDRAIRAFAAGSDSRQPVLPHPSSVSEEDIDRLLQLLKRARRVLIFAGQGALGAAASVLRLSELLGAPVTATRSARGIIPEDHPFSLRFDFSDAAVQSFNRLLDSADLILALGCKFSHNGTFGFRLHFDPAKLVHVDIDPANLEANYRAQLAIRSDVETLLARVLEHAEDLAPRAAGWSLEELAGYRAGAEAALPEPRLSGVTPPTPARFFEALARALPSGARVVTDSGLHQVLTTRHFRVQTPRGLLIPTDFQSMGFGLPAALGAQLAAPGQPVVALIGDGGFLMSGMEIATAVRERIPLTVIVFSDGSLGQIRFQQLSSYGRSHATDLLVPDLALFAESIGAHYALLDQDAESRIRGAVESGQVSILEVMVGDSLAMRKRQVTGLARSAAKRVLRSPGFRIFRR